MMRAWHVDPSFMDAGNIGAGSVSDLPVMLCVSARVACVGCEDGWSPHYLE